MGIAGLPLLVEQLDAPGARLLCGDRGCGKTQFLWTVWCHLGAAPSPAWAAFELCVGKRGEGLGLLEVGLDQLVQCLDLLRQKACQVD